MPVLSLGAHLILFIITFVVYKKISNPFVFFNLIWSILIGISIIGTSGINKPSDEIYMIFLLGGISFNIFGVAFMLLDKMIRPQDKLYVKKTYMKEATKRRIFIILNIVILLYYVYKGVELISSLLSGVSYENIRGYYYSDDFFTNTYEYLIVTYLFDPIIIVAEIIFAINMLDKKYSKMAIIMLANIILRALISGGRMIVFEFGIIVLLCFLIKRKYIKDNRKMKLEMFVIFLVAIIIAGTISAGRAEEEQGFFVGIYKTLIGNFTGSFTYFSILDNIGRYFSNSFLSVVFAGIADMFAMITNFLGLTSVELTRNTIGTILSKFYHIGELSYNAMPTMYYYFYGSLGNLGVVLGTAIMSCYCTFAYKQNKRYNTYKSLAFYLLMMLVVIESPMKWLPFDSSFIMAMFYINIFVSNKSKSVMEKNR